MPGRQFRFDYAWPEALVAVEIQGGIYNNKVGGHTSTKGVMRDMQKFNTAQLLGWNVLLISYHNLVGSELEQTRRLVLFMLLRKLLSRTGERFVNLCQNVRQTKKTGVT